MRDTRRRGDGVMDNWRVSWRSHDLLVELLARECEEPICYARTVMQDFGIEIIVCVIGCLQPASSRWPNDKPSELGQ